MADLRERLDEIEREAEGALKTMHMDRFDCYLCGHSTSGKREWVAEIARTHTCLPSNLARSVKALVAVARAATVAADAHDAEDGTQCASCIGMVELSAALRALEEKS